MHVGQIKALHGEVAVGDELGFDEVEVRGVPLLGGGAGVGADVVGESGGVQSWGVVKGVRVGFLDGLSLRGVWSGGRSEGGGSGGGNGGFFVSLVWES